MRICFWRQPAGEQGPQLPGLLYPDHLVLRVYQRGLMDLADIMRDFRESLERDQPSPPSNE